MDDALWPVVRESARRILKLENIFMKLPHGFDTDFKNLCNQISEHIPSRLIFPMAEFTNHNNIEVILTKSEQDLDGKIIEIGLDEPDIEVCWIECAVREGWLFLLEACHDLLSAGYPGCIGCGGPNSEAPWDERQFRLERKKSNRGK